MSETLQQMKARIDILEVLEKIGAKTKFQEAWDDEVAVWCPFCDDAGSAKPAARANPLKGLYFCYKCSLGGSIIDIVMAYQQAEAQSHDVWGAYSSIETAVAWLQERWPPPVEEEDDPWK